MDRRRIKILFLIDALTPGGTEHQLVTLSEGLPRTHFEPVIGVLRRSEYQEHLQLKTPVMDFIWSGMPLFKDLSVLLRLRSYLDREKFDILQTQFVDSTLLGAWAARLSRNRPCLITVRRNLYHWVDEEPWSFKLLRHTVRWTDQILVNSHSVFKECQLKEKIPVEKIMLIPNGVEVERFNGISKDEAKKRIGLGGEFPVIGAVSIWRPVKGLLSFLNAAVRVLSEISPARFILAGEGPQENELKSYVRNLGIQDRVSFIEDPSNIPMIIAALDVAVQPSLTESFSNVLLEYMAAAKPIVTTRVGDAEMVIEDGREGLLVKPNSPEELSAAILRLCKNGSKADEMGKLARIKVETNWSFSKTLDTYEQFYKNLVRKNK